MSLKLETIVESHQEVIAFLDIYCREKKTSIQTKHIENKCSTDCCTFIYSGKKLEAQNKWP